LLGRVRKIIVALELVDNRLFQFGCAIDRSVLGLAIVDRLDRRLFDVIGSIKIRLTGAQANNIAPGGAQLPGQCRNSQRGGWFDGLNAIR
jgi:hypothetical protein